MKIVGTLCRAALLAAVLVGSTNFATPALAAPEDVALLKSYIGSWRGRGQLTGANTETVVCRLTLSQGNQDKVNYNGRCTLAGSNLSIAGTLAYVDRSRRYEAVMTSNATFQGTAVGRKRGDGILFNLKERDTSEGQDLNITADILLQGGAIGVSFTVVDAKTGDTIKATVPFQK